MARRPSERAKGSTGRPNSGAIADEAKSLPDAIIDGEIVALDQNGAPDFASLQAALSEQRTDHLVFYVFDLLFDGVGDMRSYRYYLTKAGRAATAAAERLKHVLATI